jgi:hypothetical protein
MKHDINSYMDEIMDVTNEKPSAEDYIRDNISKANVLLDLVMDKVTSAERVSAEMMQSISRLIDSITTAANSLITAEDANFGLQIKADMVRLKEREIDLKSLNGVSRPTQQNIFVGSFGDLMKQINTPAARILEE